jgi:hypothetical protein
VAANIKYLNYHGNAVILKNVKELQYEREDGSGKEPFSHGKAVDNVPIELDFSNGNQTVIAPDGTLVKSAVIVKPETLIPENVKKGVNIAGIDGVSVGNLTTLSVTKNGTYTPSGGAIDFMNGGTYPFKATYTQEFIKPMYEQASAMYEFTLNDFTTGAFLIDNNDEGNNGLAAIRFAFGENIYYGLLKESAEPRFWVPEEVAAAFGHSAAGWYAPLDESSMSFAPSAIPDYPIVSGAHYLVGLSEISSIFDLSGFDGYSSVEVNVQAEGGSLACGEKTVNFYDWDGTLLYSYTKSEAMALTELPEFPTSEQFGTATAWNWTLSEIQSALSDRYWIDVGAMYTIDHTQFFMSMTDSANLKITIEFNAVSISAWSGYVLWGDGTKSSVFCSKGGAQSVSHTYSEIGDYAIELDTDSQHKISFFSGATAAIRKVWLGKRCCGSPSGNYGVNIKEIIVSDGCTGFINPSTASTYLEFLIVPPSTSMARFNGFRSLRLLSLPYAINNSYNSTVHYNNHLLKRARFWGQSQLTSSNFYSCYGLKAVHFNGVQTISNALGDSCYNLETVILPSTLTTISANFFKDSLNAKFYVPDDKVDTFKAMTYMAVHKNRIFPISQIPEKVL